MSKEEVSKKEMSEEEIKIEYQEICSDPEWCIVKIVPHADQISNKITNGQSSSKTGVNPFWDSVQVSKQGRSNGETNQDVPKQIPKQIPRQVPQQVPKQTIEQRRSRPKPVSGLNVISNNNQFTQRNINLRSHEQIESKESYDHDHDQKEDPFPFIREKDNIPKNTKIHPRQTNRNRYSSITLPQKEVDETDRSKKIKELLASISGK